MRVNDYRLEYLLLLPVDIFRALSDPLPGCFIVINKRVARFMSFQTIVQQDGEEASFAIYLSRFNSRKAGAVYEKSINDL